MLGVIEIIQLMTRPVNVKNFIIEIQTLLIGLMPKLLCPPGKNYLAKLSGGAEYWFKQLICSTPGPHDLAMAAL